MTGKPFNYFSTVFTAILISIVTINAAIVSFTAVPNKTKLSLDDQLILSVEVVCNKKLKNPHINTIPSSDWFKILRSTENQSQSTSVQIINGKVTRNTEIIYQFHYFISLQKNGSFQFPALSISENGKTYFTKPFPIVVTKQSVINPNIRASITINSKKLYVGEQTVLRIRIAQKEDAPVRPSNEGFTTLVNNVEESLKDNFSVVRLFNNTLQPKNIRINGEIHQAYDLSFSIIALNNGTTTIPSVLFQYEKLSRARTQDPFMSSFFGGGIQRTPATIRVNSLTITVTKLPPAPSNFSGAVGKFTLSTSISTNSVKAGDAVTLKIVLKGNARPASMKNLTLPSMPDFEVFKPEKHISADTTANGIFTGISYKYLIIPKERGIKKITPVFWIYFNPILGKYDTLKSQEFTITVKKGDNLTQHQTRYLTQEDIREIGSDIRYIKTPDKLPIEQLKPYKKTIFLVLYPIPFIIILFAFLYKIQSQKNDLNSSRIIQSKARKKAVKKLNALKTSTNDNSSTLAEILDNYITQRFNFSAYGKIYEDLKNELINYGVPKDTAESVVKFREKLDLSRFGKINNSTDISKITTASDLKKLIDDIEQSVKKNKKI